MRAVEELGPALRLVGLYTGSEVMQRLGRDKQCILGFDYMFTNYDFKKNIDVQKKNLEFHPLWQGISFKRTSKVVLKLY